MSDAGTKDDRILLGYRELELVNFTDRELIRRLHQKPAEPQVEQPDRDVKRPYDSLNTTQDLETRAASAFGLLIHDDGCRDFSVRGSPHASPEILCVSRQTRIYLSRNMPRRWNRTHPDGSIQRRPNGFRPGFD